MKRLVIFFLFLLSAITDPAFGQSSNGKTDIDDVDIVSLHISAALNLNPSCDDEKIGGGAGADVEWRFVPWAGIGLGAGYSMEMARFERGWRITDVDSGTWKYDQRLSFVNVPLRLYVHPLDWLTLDAGIQWSYVADKGSAKGLSSTCWSVPFGVSFGTKHRLFLRYQTRLGNIMESGVKGEVYSNPLSIGFGIRL